MSLQSPPAQLVNAYPEVYRWLVPRLQLMQRIFPAAQPTSWWRSNARNFEVGGAARSQHLLGWAADFSGPRDEARQMVAVARALGLVAIDEGDHVHLQTFRAGVVPDRFFPERFSV